MASSVSTTEAHMCHFCPTACSEDDFCYGCGTYICDAHSVSSVWGHGHAPDAHLTPDHSEDD